MRKSVISVLSVVSIVFFGCNKDFLKENSQKYVQLKDTLIIENGKSYNLPIDLRIAGNQKFSITRFPNWMVFSYLDGYLKKGSAELSFSTKNITATQNFGTYFGQLDFTVEGNGVIRKIIRFENNGSPVFNLSTPLIEAGYDIEKEFVISNTGNGRLFWKIAQYPSWVSFSATEGILYFNQSLTIKVKINRKGLINGTYRETFSVLSNAVDLPVDVWVTMEVKN